MAVRIDGLGGKAVDEVSGKVYQSKNPKYAGHTAGPWKQSEMTPIRVDTPDGSISVNWRCNWDGGKTDRLAEANAALIADAPFLSCEVERLRELCGELVGAIENTWRVIDSAGLNSLANGVEIGPTAWYVKMVDAKEECRDLISKAKGGDNA